MGDREIRQEWMSLGAEYPGEEPHIRAVFDVLAPIKEGDKHRSPSYELGEGSAPSVFEAWGLAAKIGNGLARKLIYDWLDKHQDEHVKRISDLNGEIEAENEGLKRARLDDAQQISTLNTELDACRQEVLAAHARVQQFELERTCIRSAFTNVVLKEKDETLEAFVRRGVSRLHELIRMAEERHESSHASGDHRLLVNAELERKLNFWRDWGKAVEDKLNSMIDEVMELRAMMAKRPTKEE